MIIILFKKYLIFIGKSSAETYFLYDRTGSKNQIIWDPKHKEDQAEKKFLFLEPASISIPYIKEGKEYNPNFSFGKRSFGTSGPNQDSIREMVLMCNCYFLSRFEINCSNSLF